MLITIVGESVACYDPRLGVSKVLFDKGPQLLLQFDSPATRVKVTISGIPDRLSYV